MRCLKIVTFGIITTFLMFFIACGYENESSSRSNLWRNPGNNQNVNIAITQSLSMLVGDTKTLNVTTQNTDFSVSVSPASGSGCYKSGNNVITCTPTVEGTYTVTATATADEITKAPSVLTVTAPGIEYWRVSWELNGGSWPANNNHSTQVTKNGALVKPNDPVKEGNMFDVWYGNSRLTNMIVFPYTVLRDITLYAKWTPKEDIPESSLNKTLLLELVNSYRTAGCDCGSEGYFLPTNPLTWNNTLELAAYDHSLDMFTDNFFSHSGSDGSDTGDRITRRGYSWTTWGENIAWGYRTEAEVIQGWISSPGHCSNIMYPDFEVMGIAKVGSYWTQVFSARPGYF